MFPSEGIPSMSRARVVEVDYYVLIEKLKEAANKACLIERSDSVLWKEFVAKNGVRETSLEAFGKVKFINGEPKLVGIEMGDEWDGCYAYSTDDEAALKFVPAS